MGLIEHCSWHRPSQLGYLQWHEMAEGKVAAGEPQRQCPVCRRWLWIAEWGTPPPGGPSWEEGRENEP